MTKRLLSLSAGEIATLSPRQLLEAIRASEGRILAAETICTTQPLLNDLSNAELASAMSADILILNLYDTDDPIIEGLPAHEHQESVRLLKKLTGRVIGINLEPIDDTQNTGSIWNMSPGRIANAANALKARKQGVDIITITGNPGNHVTNEGIHQAIREIRTALGDDIILITGKMHASAELKEAGKNILTKEDIRQFAAAGADIIMVPAPGTIPGMSLQVVSALVDEIHSLNKMAMTAIGTSQEGSDSDTIKTIALNSKMAGADIHHIGDSGLTGIAVPENIMAYSIVIRGRRHTYYAMARSINR